MTALATLVATVGVAAGPARSAAAAQSTSRGSWSSGYLFVVADQVDEFIAENQGVPTSALAYLGFDPNASWANGGGPPTDLQTYTSGGTPAYLGLAGGVHAPAGALSLQGATRVQTAQLLANFLATHGGLGALARYLPPPPAVLSYLAMGDSYSSGESVQPPPYIYGSLKNYNSALDECDRSSLAYPEVLKGGLRNLVNTSNVNLQFIACSGATTNQMLGIRNGTAGSHHEIPQLQQEKDLTQSAFSGRAPDLITMTAAGDDVGFTPVLRKCIEEHIKFWDSKDCVNDVAWVRHITNGIIDNMPNLKAAYEVIAGAAGPDTSILIAGYPHIMPQAKKAQDCIQLHPFLSEKAQNQINAWGDTLNFTVRQSVIGAGLNFVDPVPTFAGHAVCDGKSGDSWINGLTTVNGIKKPTWPFVKAPTGSFHPDKNGQAGYASAFAKYIHDYRASGRRQTSAGLPAGVQVVHANAAPSRAIGAPSSAGGLTAHMPVAAAADFGSTLSGSDATATDDTSTLLMGDLKLAPHTPDPNVCPVLFQGGQVVDVTGGGFAPNSSVTVTEMPDTPQAAPLVVVVTADDTGQINATLELPADLTGLQTPENGALGYVEAEGPGANSTIQSNNMLFNVGSAGANCGADPLPPATATVVLSGSAGPIVPAAGAVFAVTGPGLPELDASSPVAGTFAELDTAADQTTVCPLAEPAGVTCVGGVLGNLSPGATYTVTEITPPDGFAGSDPQTFVAPIDSSTAVAEFANGYVGPALMANATVSLNTADGSASPAGGVFALTGPGLPDLSSSSPAQGTFAELDTAEYGAALCATVEPAGVSCDGGALQGLVPDGTYTLTELGAPPGYARAEPQTFVAPTDGSTVGVEFVNSSVPFAGMSLTLASDGSSSVPIAGAIFAVAGPGLPAATVTPPASGSFAELDTAPDGSAVCAAAEALGVTCTGGVLGGLTPGSTYTVTELTPPAGYVVAAPQTFVAPTDGRTATIGFINTPLATPVLTWPAPAPITYGAALSGTQLNATASVPGTFAYTPDVGAVLGAGSHTLSVTFTPTDTANYTPTTTTVPLQVDPASPVLTWAAPAAVTYGTALSATRLNATASVPGSFAYTPDVGAVLGAGPHTLSVTFTPTDTANYTPATSTVPLQVNPASPVVTWAAPAAVTYGTALSAAQLDATASVPGTFAYTPDVGAVLGAGPQTLSVTFTPTDTANYSPVTTTVTEQVNKAAPLLSWATPAMVTYGTALSATQLNATASVPGAFAYTPAAGTVVGAGSRTLTVTFTPTDGANYDPVTRSVTLQVNQASPVLTWPAPTPITYGTALSGTQLDATASVLGSFSYTPAAGAVLGAGLQTLSVTFTPTDAANYLPVTATVGLVVNKASPAMSWVSPAAITYGTPLSATQLNATGSVPGVFSYTPTSGTVLSAGPHTLSATFIPTDAANYASASATVTLQVNKATPVLTWVAPATILYGTALSATQLNAHTLVAGTFSYTPAAGVVLQPGNQALTATFTPTDVADYTTASMSTQLTVGFSQPCINATKTGPFTVAAGQSICLGSGGKLTGPVTVAGGGVLWVNGGTITGPLTLSATAKLWIMGGAITGPVTSTGASAVTACATQITGSVNVTSSSGPVLLGGVGCAGNTITGPVTITANTRGLGFSTNKVTGPLTIKNNTGGFQYAGNTVTGLVTVTGNS